MYQWSRSCSSQSAGHTSLERQAPHASKPSTSSPGRASAAGGLGDDNEVRSRTVESKAVTGAAVRSVGMLAGVVLLVDHCRQPCSPDDTIARPPLCAQVVSRSLRVRLAVQSRLPGWLVQPVRPRPPWGSFLSSPPENPASGWPFLPAGGGEQNYEEARPGRAGWLNVRGSSSLGVQAGTRPEPDSESLAATGNGVDRSIRLSGSQGDATASVPTPEGHLIARTPRGVPTSALRGASLGRFEVPYRLAPAAWPRNLDRQEWDRHWPRSPTVNGRLVRCPRARGGHAHRRSVVF
jgi:hypothetical protein